MTTDQQPPNNPSAAGEDDWIHIGEHAFRLRASDTILLRARGDITLDNARFIFKTLISWPRPDQGFCVILNVTDLRHYSQQALRELNEVPTAYFRAVAVVGASFRHRVLIDTTMRAARFFNLNFPPGHARYLATEDLAFDWVERLRCGEA
ncbi:MAG TPA: hypothetical protein PK156_11675 [Polyangium sp.]|nr:hypothetical protein [Polyangium sp.]